LREQASAKVLVEPEAKTGVISTRDVRVRVDNQRRRKARAAVEDVLPFFSHVTAAELSEAQYTAVCGPG
jgi:hypothetical protein